MKIKKIEVRNFSGMQTKVYVFGAYQLWEYPLSNKEVIELIQQLSKCLLKNSIDE